MAAKTFKQGSLVSFDVQEAEKDPAHLKPAVLYAPGPRESFNTAAVTRDALVVTTLENVRGRAFVYRPRPHGAWQYTRLNLPDDVTIGIADTSLHGDRTFLSVTGFLQPSSLWLADVTGNAPTAGTPTMVKALPPKFDASHLTVEQFEARSSDGTRVPYFVVHPRQMKLDGGNPTIL